MKQILSLLLLSTMAVMAQVPPILRLPFTTNTPNANQFSGNAIKDGAPITNLNARSLTVQNGISVDGGWLPDNTLVRIDGTGQFKDAIIGDGLTFDGTTLSAIGGSNGATLIPTNGISISSVGENNFISVLGDISGGTNFPAVKTITSSNGNISVEFSRNPDGSTNADFVVNSAAAAGGQPGNTLLTNLASLPPGNENNTLRWQFGGPIWADDAVYIAETWAQQVSTYGGVLLGVAGGTTSASSAPNTRQNRNGFAALRVYGTNGAGGTHYSRLLYTSVSAAFGLFTNLTGFESDVEFETGKTNAILQIGFLSSVVSSNQTAGVFWEYNAGKSPNWIARCEGSSSIAQTSTIPVNINTWYKLGFQCQGTNSVVFYTNSVPFWTNSTPANMPTATMFIGSILMNSESYASGGAFDGSGFWMDTFKVYSRK